MPKKNKTLNCTPNGASARSAGSALTMAFDAERPDNRNYIIKRGKRVLLRLTGEEVIGLREDTFYLHGE